eukprot:CAMPEP_0194337316 /NCGR_PEP_ID=MMETSP0171-20130528/75920_1 /TAXON_ID=218684 /ORGANISM="Corethron pennatum, Strain L29A3" /LENGTH=120 /DNA_ID=CAMNT_0039101067 /DNA_START=100 /DNA_END=459 /DNA_ORIENTATION=-
MLRQRPRRQRTGNVVCDVRNLHEMNYILAMCKCLRGSPMPPVYMLHASWLLAFYMLCLPLALHGSRAGGATVLVASAVLYAMLGLDKISHVLEQPSRGVGMEERTDSVLKMSWCIEKFVA